MERQQVRVGYLVTREAPQLPNRRERREKLRLVARVVERESMELGYVDLGGEA